MKVSSLKSYYQDNQFNPVPIPLKNQSQRHSHFAKRQNLYERHLNLPLALLQDRSILEFGCNSGENALVLAEIGANLTLVEPNEQVIPQLRSLFQDFGLEERISALVHSDIEAFTSDRLYDVILAEGFLFTLPDRDEMVQKISQLLNPRGFTVISFNDRYGLLLEMTRRAILWRCYQLANINDEHSDEALTIAKQLYEEDFSRLNASRPFAAWWKDVLVNPFLTSSYFWSYSDLIDLGKSCNLEFYSSSPKWDEIDSFKWYKNVLSSESRCTILLDRWRQFFPFFLTGLPPATGGIELPASWEVVESVSQFVDRLSEFTTALDRPISNVVYPETLEEYLSQHPDERLSQFNREMKTLYDVAKSSGFDDLISAYQSAQQLRNLWGSPYQYICFSKTSDR